jgi:hypothetical protein
VVHVDGPDAEGVPSLQEGNIELESDRFYTLMVIAVDDQFAIYLDGDPITTIEGSGLSGRENGLGVSRAHSFNVTSGIQADIDNIKFWNLDEQTAADEEDKLSHYGRILEVIANAAPDFAEDFSTPQDYWNETYVREGMPLSDVVLNRVYHADLTEEMPSLHFDHQSIYGREIALQFDFSPYSSSDESFITVEFGSYTDYYVYKLNFDGNWSITSVQSGTPFIINQGTTSFSTGESNTIQVIRYGPEFAVILNDALLTDIGGDSSLDDRNAIGVSSATSFELDIDNILYWNLTNHTFAITGEPLAFCEPILTYIESQTPTFEEDFSSPETNWNFGGNYDSADAFTQGVVQLEMNAEGTELLEVGLWNLAKIEGVNSVFQFDFTPHDFLPDSFIQVQKTGELGGELISRLDFSDEGYSLRVEQGSQDGGSVLLEQVEVALELEKTYTWKQIVYDNQYALLLDDNPIVYLEEFQPTGPLFQLGVATDNMFKVDLDNVMFWNLDGVDVEAREVEIPTPTVETPGVMYEPFLEYIESVPPTFEDDFSTAKAGWGNNSEGFAIFDNIEDGYLRIADFFNDEHEFLPDFKVPGVSFPTTGLFDASDFALQFDFGFDDLSEVSLQFRSASTQDTGYRITFHHDGSWDLRQTGYRTSISEGVDAFSPGDHQFLLIAQDSYLAIFLDDESIFEASDITLTGTSNKIIVTGAYDGASGRCDNFKFWNLEGVDVRAGEGETPTPTVETPVVMYEPYLEYIDSTPPTFEDDFSAADMVWGGTSEGLAIFNLVDGGELTITDHSEGDMSLDHGVPGLTFPVNGLFNAADIALQFDFAFTSVNDIGVIFRSPTAQETDYKINFSNDGTWTFTRNNGNSSISNGQMSLQGNYNTVLLMVQDQYLAIFLNDNLIYEATNLAHSGTSNLISVRGNHGSEGKFDNLKFWNLEGVDVEAGDQSLAASSFTVAALDYITEQTPTFEDDFSTQKAGWGSTSEGWAIFDSLENGYLRIHDNIDTGNDFQPDFSVPGASFPITGLFDASDFALQFDFAFRELSTISLQFRSASTQDTGYRITFSQDGSWELKQTADGTSISDGKGLFSSDYYKLLLIAKGSNLSIFLNDELIYQADNLSQTSTSNEIIVVGSSDSASGRFDNFKFWNLEGVEVEVEEEVPTPSSFTLAALDYITGQTPTFEDDFSTDENQWVWGNTSEGMRIISDYRQDGLLSISDNIDTGLSREDSGLPGFSFPTNGLFNARHFAFQFDFAFASLENIGLRFRSTAAQNIYYEIMVTPSGSWQLIQEPGEILVSDGSGPRSSNWYTLLVIAQDQNLAIYLEGELIYQTDDLTLLGSSVRIIAVGNYHGAVGRFDNLRFWNLEGVDF